jgi:hypothetical protein
LLKASKIIRFIRTPGNKKENNWIRDKKIRGVEGRVKIRSGLINEIIPVSTV